MNDPNTRPIEPPLEPRHAHEHSDANLRAVLLVSLGLAVVLIALQPLLAWFFDHLGNKAEQNSPSKSPLAVVEQPPPPRLQAAPRLELQTLREQENRLLESYGWIDQPRKIVRIPIERAMALLAERGLPPGKASPPANASPPATEPQSSPKPAEPSPERNSP